MATDDPSQETIFFMQKVLLGLLIIAAAFILGLTFGACEAQAQASNNNNGGIAAYAIQHKNWPCQSMMRAFKNVPTLRLSILFNTFGTSFSCLDTWAQDPRPKYLEVQLINEVCHRNNQCGPYEFLAGRSLNGYRTKLEANDATLLSKVRDYAAPMAQWYHSHPEVACRVSYGLESNLSPKAYKNAVESLKPLFPSHCEWVWSPVGTNKFSTAPIEGMIHEGHGSTPSVVPACIVNFDGEDLSLKSRPRESAYPVEELPVFLASYASCDASFLWIAEFNGRGPGAFVDPRKRKLWPNNKMFDELNTYLKKDIKAGLSVGPWQPEDDLAKFGCKTFLKASDGYKKDFLWKQSEPPCCGRGAVTFIPRKYNKTQIGLKKVFVMKGAKKIATAYERGVYTEDNSNRQFWRFKKLAKDFPYNVVAHYGDICVVIANPKIRND